MLIVVVGPSGAGKDTLMSYAARRLAHCPDLTFVRRVITRDEGVPVARSTWREGRRVA